MEISIQDTGDGLSPDDVFTLNHSKVYDPKEIGGTKEGKGFGFGIMNCRGIIEKYKKQAEEKGLADDVKFYLEFFQYGCPPHGGFGLGIDRLTMLLCGLSIKDAEFLFRGPNRLTP